MRAMRLEGIPASPGYAEGPLFDLDRPPAAYTSKASAAQEKATLKAAIGKEVVRDLTASGVRSLRDNVALSLPG